MLFILDVVRFADVVVLIQSRIVCTLLNKEYYVCQYLIYGLSSVRVQYLYID